MWEVTAPAKRILVAGGSNPDQKETAGWFQALSPSAQ